MDADSPCAIAVRLADEGVPVAAIARATHIPSTRLYETLTLARMEGRLLDLPRDDWPPGCPRDQRSLRLSRMVTQNPEAISLAMQRVFSLTSTEVILLTALIQNVNVSRERIDMPRKTVDVHICNIRRRLAPFGITIATLWGYGYQLSVDGRVRTMELILPDCQAAGGAGELPTRTEYSD